MASGEPGWYNTRAAALWDMDNLYIGFWVEEPFVHAQLNERDDIIFKENDVEVFIDGGDYDRNPDSFWWGRPPSGLGMEQTWCL
jgi:hypothetical protein